MAGFTTSDLVILQRSLSVLEELDEELSKHDLGLYGSLEVRHQGGVVAYFAYDVEDGVWVLRADA